MAPIIPCDIELLVATASPAMRWPADCVKTFAMSTIKLDNLPIATTSMTRLWGRSHAADRIAAEIERAERERGYRFSIALVQLEGLARLPYRLGHASGDDPWPRVHGLLTRGLGRDDLCCRLSSDEFLLILSGREERGSVELVERLHREWAAAEAGHEIRLELSVGVASYPGQGSTVGALFAAADQAMDADRGRNHLASSSGTGHARAEQSVERQMPRSAA